MEQKKTVSILGCCMSRNIFNCPQLKGLFEVKNFAFQVVPWSLFDEGFDIPYEKFEEIVKSPFEQSVLDYNLNKSVFQRFLNQKTDYIVIDLMACSFVLYELTMNGKKTIARMGHGDKSLDKMKENTYFQSGQFSYKKIDYKTVPTARLYRGLYKFIGWLDKNYGRNQIILCIPNEKPHTRYLNSELKICEYDERKRKKFEEDYKFVRELTFYMMDELKGCYVYEYPENMIVEEYSFSEGLPFHYTNMDYIRQGDKMCELLNVEWRENYEEDIEPISFVLETWVKKYYDARKMLFDLENAIFFNKQLVDPFKGLSISSVFTQPFGKGLHRLSDCLDEIHIRESNAESIWQDKYMKLRADYIMLEELFLKESLKDELQDISMNEIREMDYNAGLISPSEIVGLS